MRHLLWSMCAVVWRSISFVVLIVEVLSDAMVDQLIDFVGGYKECGCLLKERNVRECCASMSSDDRKKQELSTHEGLPHDILVSALTGHSIRDRSA
jgi:hypothetical protein